jgi:gliding motility-associated-like protein
MHSFLSRNLYSLDFKNLVFKKPIAVLCLAFLCNILMAEPIFKENKGQWPEHVMFVASINSGNIFFEKNGFKFEFYKDPLYRHPLHNLKSDSNNDELTETSYHVYFQEFKNSNPNVEVKGFLPGKGHYNYILGNNPNEWASNVKAFHRITWFNLYPNIDLRVYTKLGKIKYEFVLHPGANPKDIVMAYHGVESLAIIDDALEVSTTVAKVTEHKPVSWFEKSTGKEKVACNFVLNPEEREVRFNLNLENKSIENKLIIDPFLSFSTFSGSTANNFGFTATYDEDEFLYGAGIAFSVGTYPTTLGAFQSNFGGGTVDIAVTKFSQDGSDLIYSTYLGGNLNEAPHSLVTDANDNLYILATTGSDDFPVLENAYQSEFGGGPTISFASGFGFGHPNGTDIVIIKLNPDGTALSGSTFIGGSGNDGVNIAPSLNYNYGDQFRGEIIISNAGNKVIVGSSTASQNFPTTENAPQVTFMGGSTDGVLFQLDTTLTNLEFSTYYGGSSADAIYSVQQADNNIIYIAGGTQSTNLAFGEPGVYPNFLGLIDGYVASIDIAENEILYGTYIGSNGYDQAYFVQTDLFGDVYLFGQTNGNFAMVGDVYANHNSGQFLQKLSPQLDSTIWATRIGRGTGDIDISPTAFLVNVCRQIYIAGWGGTTNNNFGSPTNSSTAGLPITSDAFQTTTDGNDFYLALFSPDMESLDYATFIGGNQSAEHADGGTSRFDVKGNVYQALCAGCFGNSDFPTTPGAWSETNNASCNMAVMKFSIDLIVPQFSIFDGVPKCVGVSIPFENLSQGGNLFFWDFGDGNTSNEFEPEHIYESPGTYLVQLVAMDTLGCSPPDTSTAQIEIIAPQNPNIETNYTVCIGDSVSINLPNNFSYIFEPERAYNFVGLGVNLMPEPGSTYTFTSIDENDCPLNFEFDFNFQEPSPPPIGQVIVFDSFEPFILHIDEDDFISILWQPEDLVSCSTCFSPTFLIDNETWFTLNYTNIFGCTDSIDFMVRINTDPFIPNAFTPNGDGINDIFKPVLSDFNEFNLMIFDRWGNLVYSSNNPQEGWNGSLSNGEMATPGVYNYRLNYTNIKAEKRIIYGKVTLLR